MSRAALSRPAARLSAFYAAIFLVAGIQLPFWPVWLAARGLTATEIGVVLAATIWGKVLAAPAIGAIADRTGMDRPIMVALAAVALVGYAGLLPITGLSVVVALNLVALTAQSAVTPLGDTVTLAIARTDGLDYGRVRLWGSVSFILASIAGGAVLASASADRVLVLVLAASALLLLACIAVPHSRQPHPGPKRITATALVAGDARFWGFVAAASALQASHQVYYGFGTLYWRSLGYSETTIGLLWAEGVVAEILLFWQGRWLLARLGPAGLMALGGAAGVVRWSLTGFVSWLPLIWLLQALHALTFGASHLGAMHYLVRTVPPSAAATAQSLYAAASSGLGGGLVMLAAGALYAAYGGSAYPAMAILSAAGLCGAVALRRAAAV
jgi:MFS transporter, PPP family, 3-phenylpropionic acid transporter